MEESIDTIINKVRETEQLMEKKRQRLLSIEKETRKVKQDTELLSMKIKELKNCQNDLVNEISQKKCELEMLQQKESLLKEMCSKKETNFQKEESSLDEMQRAVWEHREKFCEKVKEFFKRSWLSALSNIHSASQSLIVKTYLQSLTVNATEEKFCVICHATEHRGSSVMTGEEICTTALTLKSDIGDIQELEKSVQYLEEELKASDEKLKKFSTIHLSEERENLLKEPSNSLLFRELKTNLKKELDLLQRLKFECKCAAEQISYNDMMIKRISHSTKDETTAPVKHLSSATLDKWIQRSVKRKGGSSNKGKENMVPYDGQPKGNKFIGSNEELGHQVESESLALTAPHKPFVPKVPSGVLAPLSKKQNTLSPERSKIMQSHDHSNDGSLMDLEDNLEDEGEESTLLLAGNHKQFVPKIPSNLMLNHSKKQNTSNISFHYVVEEIISEEYVQHSDK